MADLAPLFALLPRLEARDPKVKQAFIRAVVRGLDGHPFKPVPPETTDWSKAAEGECKRQLVFFWRDDRWQGHSGSPSIDYAIASGEAARIVRRLQELTTCPKCGSTHVESLISVAADILSETEPDEPPPEPTAWKCSNCGHRWGEWRAGG